MHELKALVLVSSTLPPLEIEWVIEERVLIVARTKFTSSVSYGIIGVSHMTWAYVRVSWLHLM